MLAQARQIHHEGVFKFTIHFFLYAFEIVVFRAFLKLAAKDFLPIDAPIGCIFGFTCNRGFHPRCGNRFAFLGRFQMVIFIGERLIIIIDLRQVRVRKNLGEQADFATCFWFEFS